MQGAVENGVCLHCGSKAQETEQSVPYALPCGTVLHGRYLIGSVLGAGGFGITYIAMNIPDRRRIAIKEFLPVDTAVREEGSTYVQSISRDSHVFAFAREQFLKEAQTIYRLRGYPGIVDVEKLFEENNTAYFCMEYLDGQDLRKHVIASGGRLGVEETLQTMSVVLDALDYIHTRGVIHRDISPDNIYLCKNGAIKLIDFGAAFAQSRDDLQKLQRVVKQGYAPIEQYLVGGNVGAWSDLYACASTIYYCMTGIVPPDSQQRAISDTLVPPSQLGITITPEAESALLKALEVDGRMRFSSAQEMKARLTVNLRVTRAVSGETAPVSTLLRLFKQDKAGGQGTFFRKKDRSNAVSEPGGGGAPGTICLRCMSGAFEGSMFPLSEAPVRIGRDASVCEIVLPPNTSGVSRSHCEVRADPRGKRVFIRDVGSSYGTQIAGGRKLSAGQEEALELGGAFLLGHELFMIVSSDET
jgi:serine/threonine protein kinase